MYVDNRVDSIGGTVEGNIKTWIVKSEDLSMYNKVLNTGQYHFRFVIKISSLCFTMNC